MEGGGLESDGAVCAGLVAPVGTAHQMVAAGPGTSLVVSMDMGPDGLSLRSERCRDRRVGIDSLPWVVVSWCQERIGSITLSQGREMEFQCV
jgi:hypothetical protein